MEGGDGQRGEGRESKKRYAYVGVLNCEKEKKDRNSIPIKKATEREGGKAAEEEEKQRRELVCSRKKEMRGQPKTVGDGTAGEGEKKPVGTGREKRVTVYTRAGCASTAKEKKSSTR